jgi:protein TonB
MKNIFFVFLFLSFVNSFSQEDTKAKYEVLVKDSIQLRPEPREGFKIFYTNLQNNIRIPENVLNGRYRTKVSFIVDTDGALFDFKIVEETPKAIGLGEEVIRVLKTFPKWKPSAKKTYYMLPVTTVVENDFESEPKKE